MLRHGKHPSVQTVHFLAHIFFIGFEVTSLLHKTIFSDCPFLGTHFFYRIRGILPVAQNNLFPELPTLAYTTLQEIFATCCTFLFYSYFSWFIFRFPSRPSHPCETREWWQDMSFSDNFSFALFFRLPFIPYYKRDIISVTNIIWNERQLTLLWRGGLARTSG